MARAEESVASMSADPVSIAAAEWFERLQDEDVSTEEIGQWQRWLAESSTHKLAFDEIQALGGKLALVARPALPTRKEMAADRYAADVSVAEWHTRQGKPSSGLRSYIAHMAESIALPRFIPGAVAAGAIAIVALGVWKLMPTGSFSAADVYETRTSEHLQAPLPDESRLSLGGKSLVRVEFTPQKRAVVLDRGEAFFEVAKDAQRPFVVHAGETTVTAIGTAFNVRKTGERVRVFVTEGVVSVSSQVATADEPALRLKAGEQAVVEAAGVLVPARPAEPESAAAWRMGRLEYLGEPLKYVVADVNRYSRAEVVIADPNVGELLLTGTVFENDVSGWLKSLEEILPVHVVRAEDGTVRLTAVVSDAR